MKVDESKARKYQGSDDFFGLFDQLFIVKGFEQHGW